MDALQAFLEELKRHKLAGGHLLGLLHILIGRKIARSDGTPICGGMTWRDLSAALKKARWPKEAVKELGLDPKELAPRDREKFWYMTIARAQVASEEARQAGDALANVLKKHGFIVGPAPGGEGMRDEG
jgi:hypothetical protein